MIEIVRHEANLFVCRFYGEMHKKKIYKQTEKVDAKRMWLFTENAKHGETQNLEYGLNGEPAQ